MKNMEQAQLKKLAEMAGLNQPFKDVGGKDYWFKGVYFSTLNGWVPHVKIKQAFMVEEKIPELKRPIYLNALEKIVNGGITGALYSNNFFRVVHATAAQRCAAALAVGD